MGRHERRGNVQQPAPCLPCCSVMGCVECVDNASPCVRGGGRKGSLNMDVTRQVFVFVSCVVVDVILWYLLCVVVDSNIEVSHFRYYEWFMCRSGCGCC